MKKAGLLFTGLFFLLLSVNVKAQSLTADYFAGKWSVLVKGTPNGDAKMIFVLEKKVDSLVGVVQDSTGAEISKISSVEQAENQITAYFTAQGYDVNIVLTKKDDDHATGSLMGMFDADAERVKSN
jgi:hypothetical protein